MKNLLLLFLFFFNLCNTVFSQIIQGDCVVNTTSTDLPPRLQPSYITITDEDCGQGNGTIEINVPEFYRSDIIISEVTDENSGSITYIELYNGTNNSIDLDEYQIYQYNNGNTSPEIIFVLGDNINGVNTIINPTISRVIRIGNPSTASSWGDEPSDLLIFTQGAGGLNGNDRIELRHNGVLIDSWGYTSGSDNDINIPQPGDDKKGNVFRRRSLAQSDAPSLSYSFSGFWDYLDDDDTGGEEDYSGLGYFEDIYRVDDYLEYSINDGDTWQTSSEFNGLSVGTYNVRVRYLNSSNSCWSSSIEVDLDEIPIANPDPVLPTNYQTTFCESNNVIDFPVMQDSDGNIVSGVWNPNVISPTNSGLYEFTPANSCYNNFELSITINPTPTTTAIKFN